MGLGVRREVGASDNLYDTDGKREGDVRPWRNEPRPLLTLGADHRTKGIVISPAVIGCTPSVLLRRSKYGSGLSYRTRGSALPADRRCHRPAIAYERRLDAGMRMGLSLQ